jgi:predicted transcriptional regulator YdeE
MTYLGSNVYSGYESDANGLYTATVGITDNSDRTGAGFVSVKIPAGNYLVFQGEGPMPSTVVEIWKKIWNYFEVESHYQRSFISDFEAYSSSDTVAIYIGIKCSV